MRGVLTAFASNGEPAPARAVAVYAASLAALLVVGFAAMLGAAGVPAALAAPGGAPTAPPRATGSSAATLYALNCMGCHPPPKTREHDAGPLRGEFFHSDKGRNFFIRMPDGSRRLSASEEERLLEEVLTWKRACAAIRQDAPMVDYRGERFVR